MSRISDNEASQEVIVRNEQGMHARPVMQFVDLANRFESMITVSKEATAVDGKSPMEMMLLEATRGTRLVLRARGIDAHQAIEALAGLISNSFEG